MDDLKLPFESSAGSLNYLTPPPGWILPLGIVLFAFGARLALVHYFGHDQPVADQWAAEGATLFRAEAHGILEPRNFFVNHGEHRPMLTRALTYTLFLANDRQWDAKVQMIANLGIHIAFVFLWWTWARKSIAGPSLVGVAIAGTVLLSMPSNFENFLWGFQSQFLFLLLLGLAHLAGTLHERRLSTVWWLGQFAGLAGLFSIAAGMMSAVALLPVAITALLRNSRDRWARATVISSFTLLAIGIAMLPGNVIGDSPSRVREIGSFIKAWSHLLAWPKMVPGWMVIVQLPLLAVFAIPAVRRQNPETAARLAVGAVWIWLVAFTIAFGRGATPDSIAVRYYDILAAGLAFNLIAIGALCSLPRRRWRIPACGIAFAWALVVGSGLWHYNDPRELAPTLFDQHVIAEKRADAIRSFIATGDSSAIREDPEIQPAFPHMQLTLDFLADPLMHSVLPPSLSPLDRVGPLSRMVERFTLSWPGWMLTGAFLICLSLFLSMPGHGGRIKSSQPDRRME